MTELPTATSPTVPRPSGNSHGRIELSPTQRSAKALVESIGGMQEDLESARVESAALKEHLAKVETAWALECERGKQLDERRLSAEAEAKHWRHLAYELVARIKNAETLLANIADIDVRSWSTPSLGPIDPRIEDQLEASRLTAVISDLKGTES